MNACIDTRESLGAAKMYRAKIFSPLLETPWRKCSWVTRARERIGGRMREKKNKLDRGKVFVDFCVVIVADKVAETFSACLSRQRDRSALIPSTFLCEIIFLFRKRWCTKNVMSIKINVDGIETRCISTTSISFAAHAANRSKADTRDR